MSIGKIQVSRAFANAPGQGPVPEEGHHQQSAEHPGNNRHPLDHIPGGDAVFVPNGHVLVANLRALFLRNAVEPFVDDAEKHGPVAADFEKQFQILQP